jgi:hypothetical protein
VGIGLALLCTPACRCGHGGTPEDEGLDYKIEYWSNSVSEEYPTMVAISSSASPLLMVGSNADDPGAAPVGRFSVAPAAARTGAFMRATLRLMRSAERKAAPALPGQVVRELKVVSNSGSEQVRYGTERAAPDPEFLTAEAEAVTLARFLRQHPKTALSAQATFRPTKPDRLEFAVKLVNVGIDPLAIPHPDVWADGSTAVTVVARRNDVPLAQLSNKHQRFVNLSQAQITGTKPPLEPGRTITLAPTREVTLTFATDLPLPRGSYDILMRLETAILDPQGALLMRAELVSGKEPWLVP